MSQKSHCIEFCVCVSLYPTKKRMNKNEVWVLFTSHVFFKWPNNLTVGTIFPNCDNYYHGFESEKKRSRTCPVCDNENMFTFSAFHVPHMLHEGPKKCKVYEEFRWFVLISFKRNNVSVLLFQYLSKSNYNSFFVFSHCPSEREKTKYLKTYLLS